MSGAKELIRVAKSQVGYREGYSDGHWNNKNRYGAWYGMDEAAWCGIFVSWVAAQSGNTAVVPRYAWCPSGVEWYRSRGRFSVYPVIGGIVFFGAGGGSHTGIVYRYDAESIFTIEGNTNANGSAEGDGVYLKQRARKSSYVYGYGIPAFAEGVVVADPEWKGRKGVTFFGQEASEADIPSGGGGTPAIPAFPGAQYFKAGAVNDFVTQLGKALVRHGLGRFYSVGPGRKWGDADRNAVRAFQLAQGWSGSDADGYPGSETWHRLMQ
ncbi:MULTISPECIES: peptidoglycan-binding protein [unclassified Streptomyces]|uniref:peptidoglycan-binding protein n=1 Tax=unclassified Streptomyces TaxID=2593676 RepID=UPI002F356CD6